MKETMSSSEIVDTNSPAPVPGPNSSLNNQVNANTPSPSTSRRKCPLIPLFGVIPGDSEIVLTEVPLRKKKKKQKEIITNSVSVGSTMPTDFSVKLNQVNLPSPTRRKPPVIPFLGAISTPEEPEIQILEEISSPRQRNRKDTTSTSSVAVAENTPAGSSSNLNQVIVPSASTSYSNPLTTFPAAATPKGPKVQMLQTSPLPKKKKLGRPFKKGNRPKKKTTSTGGGVAGGPAPGADSTPMKRKPGRPFKNGTGLKNKAPPASTSIIKRKRGRPFKNPPPALRTKVPVQGTSNNIPSGSLPMKRKPGRPFKNPPPAVRTNNVNPAASSSSAVVTSTTTGVKTKIIGPSTPAASPVVTNTTTGVKVRNVSEAVPSGSPVVTNMMQTQQTMVQVKNGSSAVPSASSSTQNVIQGTGVQSKKESLALPSASSLTHNITQGTGVQSKAGSPTEPFHTTLFTYIYQDTKNDSPLVPPGPSLPKGSTQGAAGIRRKNCCTPMTHSGSPSFTTAPQRAGVQTKNHYSMAPSRSPQFTTVAQRSGEASEGQTKNGSPLGLSETPILLNLCRGTGVHVARAPPPLVPSTSTFNKVPSMQTGGGSTVAGHSPVVQKEPNAPFKLRLVDRKKPVHPIKNLTPTSGITRPNVQRGRPRQDGLPNKSLTSGKSTTTNTYSRVYPKYPYIPPISKPPPPLRRHHSVKRVEYVYSSPPPQSPWNHVSTGDYVTLQQLPPQPQPQPSRPSVIMTTKSPTTSVTTKNLFFVQCSGSTAATTTNKLLRISTPASAGGAAAAAAVVVPTPPPQPVTQQAESHEQEIAGKPSSPDFRMDPDSDIRIVNAYSESSELEDPSEYDPPKLDDTYHYGDNKAPIVPIPSSSATTPVLEQQFGVGQLGTTTIPLQPEPEPLNDTTLENTMHSIELQPDDIILIYEDDDDDDNNEASASSCSNNDVAQTQIIGKKRGVIYIDEHTVLEIPGLEVEDTAAVVDKSEEPRKEVTNCAESEKVIEGNKVVAGVSISTSGAPEPKIVQVDHDFSKSESREGIVNSGKVVVDLNSEIHVTSNNTTLLGKALSKFSGNEDIVAHNTTRVAEQNATKIIDQSESRTTHYAQSEVSLQCSAVSSDNSTKSEAIERVVSKVHTSGELELGKKNGLETELIQDTKKVDNFPPQELVQAGKVLHEEPISLASKNETTSATFNVEVEVRNSVSVNAESKLEGKAVADSKTARENTEIEKSRESESKKNSTAAVTEPESELPRQMIETEQPGIEERKSVVSESTEENITATATQVELPRKSIEVGIENVASTSTNSKSKEKDAAPTITNESKFPKGSSKSIETINTTSSKTEIGRDNKSITTDDQPETEAITISHESSYTTLITTTTTNNTRTISTLINPSILDVTPPVAVDLDQSNQVETTKPKPTPRTRKSKSVVEATTVEPPVTRKRTSKAIEIETVEAQHQPMTRKRKSNVNAIEAVDVQPQPVTPKTKSNAIETDKAQPVVFARKSRPIEIVEAEAESGNGRTCKRKREQVPIGAHIKHLDNGFYICIKCNRKFKSKGNIAYHDSCANKAKLLKCELCGAGLKSKSHLKYHNLACHSTDRPFVCSECGQSFIIKAKLNRHERHVHRGERPFQCKTCLMRVTTQQQLKIHMRRHSGEKPFLCTFPDCEKKFAAKAQLKRHDELHHQNQGVKRHPCLECGAYFKTTSGLTHHVKTVHYGEKALFNCPECDRPFNAYKDVTRHINTKHSEIRPYKCTTCGTEFKRKDNMIRHLCNVHKIKRNDISLNIHYLESSDDTLSSSSSGSSTETEFRTAYGGASSNDLVKNTRNDGNVKSGKVESPPMPMPSTSTKVIKTRSASALKNPPETLLHQSNEKMIMDISKSFEEPVEDMEPEEPEYILPDTPEDDLAIEDDDDDEIIEIKPDDNKDELLDESLQNDDETKANVAAGDVPFEEKLKNSEIVFDEDDESDDEEKEIPSEDELVDEDISEEEDEAPLVDLEGDNQDNQEPWEILDKDSSIKLQLKEDNVLVTESTTKQVRQRSPMKIAIATDPPQVRQLRNTATANANANGNGNNNNNNNNNMEINETEKVPIPSTSSKSMDMESPKRNLRCTCNTNQQKVLNEKNQQLGSKVLNAAAEAQAKPDQTGVKFTYEGQELVFNPNDKKIVQLKKQYDAQVRVKAALARLTEPIRKEFELKQEAYKNFMQGTPGVVTPFKFPKPTIPIQPFYVAQTYALNTKEGAPTIVIGNNNNNAAGTSASASTSSSTSNTATTTKYIFKLKVEQR